MTNHVAQLNVARLLNPLDHEHTSAFVAALGPINELAESSEGFVWRLTDDEGASSSYVPVEGIDDPLMIVNYSIWEDLDSLHNFVYRTAHTEFMRRRREWFERLGDAYSVCWWIPAGTIPAVGEACERLRHLRAHGPSVAGWPLNRPLPPPDPS